VAGRRLGRGRPKRDVYKRGFVGSSQDAIATPATVAATAAIGAPTVQAGAKPAPATVAATAAISGTAQAGARPTPATVAAVAAVAAPTVQAGAKPTPATVAATADVPAPAVQGGAVAAPATVAAVASVGVPDMPPTTPTGLTSTAIRATEADLTWNASTDDTAVAFYEVVITAV
jgi:hypothetical protein